MDALVAVFVIVAVLLGIAGATLLVMALLPATMVVAEWLEGLVRIKLGIK